MGGYTTPGEVPESLYRQVRLCSFETSNKILI